MAVKVKTVNRRRELSVTARNHSVSGTTTRQVVTWTDTRNSQGLKNWKTIIANNGNATTPFTGTKGDFVSEIGSASLTHSHDFTPGVIYTDDAAGQLSLYSGIRSPSDLQVSGLSISETSAENQALTQLRKRIQEQHTKFQGGVFLGEFMESVRMIRSPAKALREGISAYVTNVRRYFDSNKLRTWRKSRQDQFLAKSWLEYSFGWMPLIHDIQDGVDAFWTFCHPADVPTRLSASGRASEIVPTYTGSGSTLVADGSHISAFWQRRETLDVLVRYRCGHLLQRTASFQNGSMSKTRLRNLFGFSPEQFIPTVWELIPYSFLVDYFVNIGDLLSAAVTDTAGVTWICRTVRKSRTHEKSVTRLDMAKIQNDIGGSLGHVLGTSFTPSYYEASWTSVSRSPVSSLGMPSLEFTYPGAGSLKWLNIAALAGQRRL